MTLRTSLIATAAACLALTSHAMAWTPDGVTVRSTTSPIPIVAACSDASGGAIVAWNEDNLPRAQHLLPDGRVDPGWPQSGVVLSNVAAGRFAMGAISDGLGGAYVWWMEAAILYLTRVDPQGVVAPGWPARGRLIYALRSPAHRPDVIADGANGVYLVWAGLVLDVNDPSGVLALRVGPANSGWSGPRSVSPPTLDYTLEEWPQAALAPDGGLFVAWASGSLGNPAAVPSAWRLKRMAPAGTPAPGWAGDGIEIRGLAVPAVLINERWSRIDLAPDGEGGVYAFIAEQYDSTGMDLDPRVYRLDADGAKHEAWGAAGTPVSNLYVGADVGPDGSIRVFRGGASSVVVGAPQYSVHWPSYLAATVVAGTGGTALGGLGTVASSEMVPSGGGGAFMAAMKPTGPSGPYEPCAFLSLRAHPPGAVGLQESHCDPVVGWYGDIALAPTGDGGVYFFWSQHRERFGLFARRFNEAGQVVSVDPSPTHGAPSSWFVRGEGVHASGSLGPQTDGRLELFDLAGRLVASMRIDRAGPFDVVVPGTTDLSSGLYFVRLRGGSSGGAVKVVVGR